MKAPIQENQSRAAEYLGRSLTKGEQDAVDFVARSSGRAWADQNAYLIIDQAKHIGELDEDGN